MTFIYRPKHPKANENGMVDRALALDSGSESALYVISDEMPPTRHMVTGEYFTSKAKFRAATKAAGCVEVGNETKTLLKPRKKVELSRDERARDIRNSIEQLRSKR